METPVLATKLFRPSRRERLVERWRLIEELDRSLAEHHRLTLVSAPAGFGKTTLLGDWLDSLAPRRTDVDIAWLSLDGADNDPARLLRHLVAALRRCGVEVDPGPDSSDVAAALADLVNELTGVGERRLLLVLDDYHVIDDAAVHEAIGFLLDNLPRGLHLVLATRSDPPLPLTRLRVRDQLVELRAADLRFTPEEARDFLNQVMGLDLTTRDVEALEARTEGWAAGLQLAALSLRATRTRDETDRFIGDFAGSNRFVIDYLVDEVLARVPPETHRFLLHTSVLDRLTGPLCDAMMGGAGGIDGADGAGTLARLDRDNLFVVALDAERSWYRYHHLFADVLHARLLAEQPDAAPALHRRATAWYADHDMLPEAIRHALLGGDAARAAHLVERAVPRTRRAREDATLLGWIGALPDDAVRRSPVLSLVAGWSMLMAGDLDATERRLDDADAALAAGEGDPELRTTWAETEDLRTAPATVSVYRAALAQARGDTAGTVDHACRALDLAAPDDHLVRGSAGGFLGLAAWAAGDVERAIATFSDAVRSLRAAGNLVDALDSTVVLADMWLTAGRPEEARRLYDRALATATAQGEPYPRATADLHVGLAELDLERNDLDGAQAHLDTAKTLGERTSITENRHRWYVAAARLRAATGDHAAATDLLDQAQALFRPGFYPDLRPIPAVRTRVQIAAGDLESASRWARDAGLGLDDEPVFLREYELLTLVRLHLARHGRSDQVLRTLRRVRAAAEPARAATLLEVGILAALARHAAGDTPGAVAELTHAAGRVPEPQSHARLFLDEGAPMVALLGEAARAGDDPARRILGSARTRPPAHTGGGPADPLSGRELDVLRMLASDLTGPEIARQLYVSLNTLRTHTKHIFTKLDVNTRAAAVRRGRALGLI